MQIFLIQKMYGTKESNAQYKKWSRLREKGRLASDMSKFMDFAAWHESYVKSFGADPAWPITSILRDDTGKASRRNAEMVPIDVYRKIIRYEFWEALELAEILQMDDYWTDLIRKRAMRWEITGY